MTERVLVPMDGAEPSERALEYALSTHGDDELVVLHVVGLVESADQVDALSGDRLARHERAMETAEEVFEFARRRAEETDADLTTALEYGPPSRVVPEYAGERGFDHVVIGDHGEAGARQILLGSVAEEVVRRSPVTVTVVRE